MSRRPATIEDVMIWRNGFPEGSFAREALDLLLEQAEQARADRDVYQAHGARLAEAWRILQRQGSDYQVWDAFLLLDRTLISEGTIDDASKMEHVENPYSLAEDFAEERP